MLETTLSKPGPLSPEFDPVPSLTPLPTHAVKPLRWVADGCGMHNMRGGWGSPNFFLQNKMLTMGFRRLGLTNPILSLEPFEHVRACSVEELNDKHLLQFFIKSLSRACKMNGRLQGSEEEYGLAAAA